jgi:hypothetical protein
VVLRRNETAAENTINYAWDMKVQTEDDMMVRSANIEYKIPREQKFWVTMRPIHNQVMHKLVTVVPIKELTFEDELDNGMTNENDEDLCSSTAQVPARNEDNTRPHNYQESKGGCSIRASS